MQPVPARCVRQHPINLFYGQWSLNLVLTITIQGTKGQLIKCFLELLEMASARALLSNDPNLALVHKGVVEAGRKRLVVHFADRKSTSGRHTA